jgi:acyl carrier protein
MPQTHDDYIVSRVTEFVAEQLGDAAEGISPDTDLRNIEGVDSVKTLRVIAKTEKEFDVMFEDEDVFGVSSINDVAGLVEQKSAAAQQ